MPGALTQAQQTFGTGPQSARNLAARQAGGTPQSPGFSPENPYGIVGDVNLFNQFAQGAGYGPGADAAQEAFAARNFGQLFGNVTPQARVAIGAPATGPVTPGGPAGEVGEDTRFANGGGANNAPVAPKSTPQAAGDNNSMMPGWSTGNDQVGTPAPAGAGGAPLPGRTPTDPLNVALGGIPRPGAAGETMVGTNEPAAPPPGMGDVPMKSETVETAPGTPVQDDGTGTKPTNPPAAEEWASIAHAWNPGNATPPTTFDPLMYGPAPSIDAPSALVSGRLREPYLRNLVVEIGRRVEGGYNGQSLASIIAAGPAGQGKHFGGWLATTEKMIDLLNSAAPGLGWDPVSSALQRPSKWTPSPAGGGGTTGGGTTGGGTGTGGGTTSAGGVVSNTTMGNLSDYDARAEAMMRSAGLKGFNDPKMAPFLAEYKMSLMQLLKAQDDQQGALNIYGGAVDAFKNDPLRAQQVAMMGGLLAKPDNTPWDTIRGQAITGAHQTAEDVNKQYALTAQRRLGSAGAGAAPGVFADISRRQGGDLQNHLAQLAIQQAEGEQAAKYRALGAADSIRASTTGADAQMAESLANIRRAVANGGTPVLQGAGNALIDSTSFNQMLNAQGSDWGGIGDFFKGFLGVNTGTQTGAMGAGFKQQLDSGAQMMMGGMGSGGGLAAAGV